MNVKGLQSKSLSCLIIQYIIYKYICFYKGLLRLHLEFANSNS